MGRCVLRPKVRLHKKIEIGRGVTYTSHSNRGLRQAHAASFSGLIRLRS